MTHKVNDKKFASKEAIVSALEKATTPVSEEATTPALKKATTPVSFETMQILMKILLIFIEVKSIYKDKC